MKSQTPMHDIQKLSEYLDDQLPEKARDRLETRLANDDLLRQALDDLRKTRQVIRNAPVLRTPRNFILTPSMIGQVQPGQSKLYPLFGLATVAAMMLLIFFLIGDFVYSNQFMLSNSTSLNMSPELAVGDMSATSEQMVIETVVVEAEVEESTLYKASPPEPAVAEADTIPVEPALSKKAIPPSDETQGLAMTASLTDTEVITGSQLFAEESRMSPSLSNTEMEFQSQPKTENGLEQTLLGLSRPNLITFEVLLGIAVVVFGVMAIAIKRKSFDGNKKTGKSNL